MRAVFVFLTGSIMKRKVRKLRKLLLFDFDGAIVDSLDFYEEAIRLCFEKIGQPFAKTRADFLELFDDNFYVSLRKKNINIDTYMQAAEEVLARSNYALIKPIAGLLPVLAKLQAENILVIISSSGSSEIRAILDRLHITAYFHDILGSDAGFSKKEKIRFALARYKVGDDQAFYIGDTTGDIKEAKAVGIRTIAVTWGWHSRERLATLAPDWILDQPRDLLAVLSAFQPDGSNIGKEINNGFGF